MANVVLRWRRPLIMGAGIWLLTFPLLTWHPAAASHPTQATSVVISSIEADEHRLMRQLARQASAALEAAQALAAATTPAPPAAPLVASAAGQPGRHHRLGYVRPTERPAHAGRGRGRAAH